MAEQEAKKEEKLLSAKELLEKVFESIVKRIGGKEVVFEKPISVSIDIDWDPCRGTSHYCLEYKSVWIVEVNGKKFILGLGKHFDYDRRPLALADIIIASLKGKISEAENQMKLIAKSAGQGEPNNRSVVIAWGGYGTLSFDNNWSMEKRLLECQIGGLDDKIRKLVSEEIKLDPRFVNFELKIKLGTERPREYEPLGYKEDNIKPIADFVISELKRRGN